MVVAKQSTNLERKLDTDDGGGLRLVLAVVEVGNVCHEPRVLADWQPVRGDVADGLDRPLDGGAGGGGIGGGL